VNGAGNPISPNQMCTRLGELRDSGLVELKREFYGGPVIETETTPGNTGQVHRLTAYGVTATVALAAADRPQVA
jgi:DNA-binding IscR family transcriptional regulator